MKKFMENSKVLAREYKVTHVLSSSCLFVLDLVSSFISSLYPPIKQCILNMLSITVTGTYFTKEDNCPEAKYCLEAARSTKAKCFEDDEDDSESYQQALLERAKRLKQEDTSHYFSSSAMLDDSSDNFSEYESEKEDGSVPIMASVDTLQLKDNDLNLSG